MKTEQCMESYKIIFKGLISEGKDTVKIGKILAKFLKLPESKADQLFNGKAYALKKNLNHEKAHQVQDKLSSIGIITEIVKEVSISDTVSFQEGLTKGISDVDFETLVDGKKCCKHCGSNLEMQPISVNNSLHFVGDKLGNIDTDAIKDKLKNKAIDISNEIKSLADLKEIKSLLPSTLGLILCLTVVLLGFIFIGFGEYDDSPYPMNQKSLQALSDTLASNAKGYDRSPNDSNGKAIKDIYQATLQDDFGYSFDKTIRAVLVFGYGERSALEVFRPALQYIIHDKNSALEEGIISKRTFELISLPQNSFDAKQQQFIKYVIECQKRNDGVCAADVLIETIKDENNDPEISKIFKKYAIGSSDLRDNLSYKLEYSMPSGNVITKPDGSKFNTNFMFIGNDPFKVDNKKVEDQLRASEILEEEKQSLFN